MSSKEETDYIEKKSLISQNSYASVTGLLVVTDDFDMHLLEE